MAVQIVRPEPASTERIRRQRRPTRHAPPGKAVVSAIREVVRHAATVEDAKNVVKAMNAAWSDVSAETRASNELLLVILELSEGVEEALTTYAMLRSDGALLEPLTAIREFVRTEFPDAQMRIIPGDDVASSYLYVMIPTEDYQAFWEAQMRLVDWSIEHFPKLGPVIQISPRPVTANV